MATSLTSWISLEEQDAEDAKDYPHKTREDLEKECPYRVIAAWAKLREEGRV